MVCGSCGGRSAYSHKTPSQSGGYADPGEIRVTGDLEQAMKDKELLVLSVPSVYVRETAHRMASLFKGRAGHYQCSQRGLRIRLLKICLRSLRKSFRLPGLRFFPGPSHAEEVSRGLPDNLRGRSAQKTGCGAGAEPCL